MKYTQDKITLVCAFTFFFKNYPMCVPANSNDWFEIDFSSNSKGSFQKKNDETYGKFHILGGGRVSGGNFPYVITEDLKCIKSHFEHF